MVKTRTRLTATCLAIAAMLALAACAAPATPVTGPASPPPSASGGTTAPAHVAGSARSISFDGRVRTYQIYVPSTASSTAAVPLLVALHGGGGSGARFEQVSGFDEVAEAAGFIVVYPDAVSPPGDRMTTWNAGDCCGYAARTDVDDVGFVQAVIAAVTAQYHVDPRRIFLAGHSNGGMLAYRMACESSVDIAAIGVQSTTLEYAPCRPRAPVSFLHIHGTADTNIPITGGHGSEVSQVDFLPPPQAAATLAAADGCGSASSPAPDPTLPGAQQQTWTACPPGVAAEFVTVPGAAHAWMNTSAQQIWSFLSAHPAPR